MTSSLPFQYVAGVALLTVPGRDSTKLPRQPVLFAPASRDYLRTIRLRLKAGRWFDNRDYGSVTRTAVINETMAKAYWPGESPLGQCLTAGVLQCLRVVGVVADTRLRALREDPKCQLDIPARTERDTLDRLPRTLVFRTDRPRTVVPAVRAAIQAAVPTLPYLSVESVESLIAPHRRSWTIGARMLALFAVLALLLAGIELYGSMSWIVADRTFEFGIRIALGAPRSRIFRQIVGVSLVVGGLLIRFGVILCAGTAIQPRANRDPTLRVGCGIP